MPDVGQRLERHADNAGESDRSRTLVRRHANSDVLLWRVEPQRPVKAIPDGETARPVRVSFGFDDGVMDAVHARRDEEGQQTALPPRGQAHIGMMEEDAGDEPGLPEEVSGRREADEQDLRRAPGNGREQFAEVEAERGGGVEIEIDVMDKVESPEERHAMREDVPEVHGVVHQDERGDDFESARKRAKANQPDAAAFGKAREANRDGAFGELHGDGAHGGHGEIPDFAGDTRLDRAAQRTAALDPVDGDEAGGEQNRGDALEAGWLHVNILRSMMPLIVLFARKPVPGRVKTRLGLDPEDAARLHDRFVRETLELLRGVEADIEISTDEECANWAEYGHARSVQRAGDLGERMFRAIARGLAAGRGRVMILGSDSPGLPRGHIAELLVSRADVALGPTEDGGYYAIACRRADERMFAGVRWSSAWTREDTVRAAKECGFTVEIGPGWFDVDTPEDLERWRSRRA